MADAQKDTRTVFVRGISFDVDEKPLEELFSNIGPVKQCFLVRQKGETKHKGLGFVTFALPEDAQRAIEELHGKSLGGRKLLVEHANKRASFEERKRKRVEAVTAPAQGPDDAEAEPAPPKKPAPAPTKPIRSSVKAVMPTQVTDDSKATAQGKHKHMCTVAIGGLTPETVPVAVGLAKKAGKVQEVIQPAPAELVDRAHLKSDGCSGTVILVVYSTVQDAMQAVTQLHGKKVSAQGEGAAGKKKRKLDNGAAEGDAAVAPCTVWARQVAGEGAHVRKWRVIVRNLAFKVTEAALRTAFSAAGFVWELTVPKSPDGRAKGFAFVGFTLRAHAQKAIELINNKEIAGRPVSVDWALSKAQFESAAGKANGSAGPPSEEADDDEEQQQQDDDDDDDDESELDEEEEEEEDAVVGKSKGSKSKAARDEDDGYALDDDDDDDDDGDDDDDDDDDGEDEEEEVEEDAERAEEQRTLHNVMASLIGDDDEAQDDQQQLQQEKPAVNEGKGQQQDVKGMPDADSKKGGRDSKAGVAAAAGEQKPAAADSSEAVSRTVFVRGLPLDTTKVALQAKMESYGRVKACRLVIDKTTQQLKGTAFIEFMSETGAKSAADACTRGRQSKGPGVVFGGKTLDVDLALSADQARKVSESKAGGSLPKDKRNLYLAKEGEIKQGSAAWNSMSEHDKEKRLRCADEKRTKLKSPNFLISPVRLSVRNIPFSMTEARLRSLAVKAVKERANQEKPEVTQIKILRDDTGKVGPDGKPKSKGMGFIEFSDHAHAVACLRQMNNNPDVFTRDKRPIVEFAIDNVKVLKKLEAIQARRQQQAAGAKAGTGRPAEAHGDKAAGDGDGQDEVDTANLTPRERKKLKAKAKMQRRKQRQLEAKGAASSEGGEEAAAGSKEAGSQQAEPEKAKPARKKKPAKQQQQAGADKQQDQQRRGGQQKGAAKVEVTKGRQGRTQGSEQPSKRRREDDEIDKVAEAALVDSYSGMGKRRRRNQEEEQQDKLDKLAETYKKKLAGDRPQRNGAAKGRPGTGVKPGQKGQAAAKGGNKPAPVALDLKGDSIKRWFE